MYKYSLFLGLVLCSQLMLSCEKAFDPVTTYDGPQLVVEGYIQVGPDALPPYVILTKSVEYSSNISNNTLNDLFVHDAEVRISNGNDTIVLQELCLNDLTTLPPLLQDAVTQALGIPSVDSIAFDICVYSNIFATVGIGLNVVPGERYDLEIVAQGFDTLRSSTNIPLPVPIDSLSYANHPGFPKFDSLVEVIAYFSDPLGPNYYRSYSQRNSEPMYPSGTRGTNGSVTDDNIFDGQNFSFGILRGQDPFDEFDFDTFGYFWRGDTVVVRASSIDYAHFRFWQTLEYNTGSQGPFGTYTRIETNIEGGMGIWGGISYNEYQIIIPE